MAQLSGVISLLLGILLAFWVIHFIIETLSDIQGARSVGMSLGQFRAHEANVEHLRSVVGTESREYAFLEEERHLKAQQERLEVGIAYDLTEV